MVYAASQEYVKTAFQGLNKPIQANDPEEFSIMEVLKSVSVPVHKEIETAKGKK